MIQLNIKEEYAKALRTGQKESRELMSAGKDPYPSVMDEIVPDSARYTVQELPIREIPIDKIIGTKSAGRISAFSAGFYPLLDSESEFAVKWMKLCEAHLSDAGIRDAIECYEYLGSFYVQEGNKRLSVLKYFGAVNISARIKRLLPAESEDPRIKAYYEFLWFYNATGLYDIQYKKPGDYAKLLAALGKRTDEVWEEQERRRFSTLFYYFKQAFQAVNRENRELTSESALLLWLQVHSFEELGTYSARELKSSLLELWGDVQVSAEEAPSLRTTPDNEKKNLLEKVIGSVPKHLHVAMIYLREPETSTWIRGHRQGAEEMEAALADRVDVRHYDHADTAEQAEELLDKAVADGAELVFTTAPLLLRPTLKAAVRYPKVRFLNCSTGTQLSSVRSYYCRTYEGKFITGVIAGALAENDLVGYIGSYPILGVPASINAFALGVRMTNPRARILLDWSCLDGDAVQKLRERGARIISNRDIPLSDQRYMDQGLFGTFRIDRNGKPVPLASPCWKWGRLYETIAASILEGKWAEQKSGPEAINYWWGMDSGAMDVELTDRVPAGVRTLAELLMSQLRQGSLDIFRQPITTQDGRQITDGTAPLSTAELLRMDWLCDMVEGHIPAYEELLPMSRSLVRELGVYRDLIPPETGGRT